MVDTVSIAALATQMSNQNTSEQLETAVLAKANGVEQQQGLDALQLIQASVVSPDKIDVHV